ncbi:hypothetical protein BKA66DRAFT_208798 [Pyrenochaeta sp. MPI-SDFR-AT-0127]|nr:hypothetical protein BKA66DRAFT_208798 [Pyrenochaeta sp. MPI-SDFR-AT-0127]
MDLVGKVQAISAKEQPRQAVNESNRCGLPRAEPLRQQQSSLLQILHQDCRLLIWEHILRPSQTRIERWRIPNRSVWVSAEDSDADCFPYRITAAEWDKSEKPLNLLLSCRQLYLEGLAILYSTTFVFEMPLDLYSFQLCVSPEGLLNVKRLIIAFGQTDWHYSGPFFSRNTKHPHGSLNEWENAIHGLKKMRSLQELQVWLGHYHVRIPELERRPWKENEGSQMLEQRHQKLFDLYDALEVPNFTVHLTWNPEDLLSRRTWPFQIILHTKDEMMHVLDKDLPEKTVPDLYDW